MKRSASIPFADFGKRVEERAKAIERAGNDLVHLDVMEGHFVPYITAGSRAGDFIRQITNLPHDD